MKEKGFTLIELLAVIVILAIITLITIPIVLNTINNSEENAEKQSVIGYARVLENDIANYLLDPKNKLANYEVPDNLDYKGNTVFCDSIDLSTGKLKLTNCYVSDKKLSDEEKAKKNLYDYDNGKVTKVSKSEESNNNSSTPTTYTAYSIGDEITVLGEQYYVISASNSSKDYVTALKANPLTVDEINTYGGVGTENNHVNKYTDYSRGTAYDFNDANHTGGMAYYTCETCGYTTPENHWSDSGCTTDYASSEVKFVVDKWASKKFTDGELKIVDGYGARLISYDDLMDNFGYQIGDIPTQRLPNVEHTPSWLWNSGYHYWTMSQQEDYFSSMWTVLNSGFLTNLGVTDSDVAVRPVINVYKNKIES